MAHPGMHPIVLKIHFLRIRKYERAIINDSGDMYLSIKDFRDNLISVNRL